MDSQKYVCPACGLVFEHHSQLKTHRNRFCLDEHGKLRLDLEKQREQDRRHHEQQVRVLNYVTH